MFSVTANVTTRAEALAAVSLYTHLATILPDAPVLIGATEQTSDPAPAATRGRPRAAPKTETAPAAAPPAATPPAADPVAAYLAAGGTMPTNQPAPVVAEQPAAVVEQPAPAVLATAVTLATLAIGRDAALDEVRAYARQEGAASWLRDLLTVAKVEKLSAISDENLAAAVADVRGRNEKSAIEAAMG